MRILVTGGAGYIGSIVAAELLSAGHEVTVYDSLVKGIVESVPAAAEFVQGDVADRSALDTLFAKRRFDAVMHFAAFIEAGESMQEPERYFRNNTAATLNLLDTMVAHNVTRFVFSSTAALFGNPESTPIRETATLRPTNAYGESKLLTERMLDWLQRLRGLRYAALRYFNAAGATAERGEVHTPETHIIPLVLHVAMGKRDSVSIYGTDYPTPDGTCVRDYIHVLDLARAHVLALDALGHRDRLVYNLGNGMGFSVREVIEAARRVTGKPIKAVDAPRRSGDSAVLVASSELIRSDLGWRPLYPDLESIIGSAWEWYQKHPTGYGTSRL